MKDFLELLDRIMVWFRAKEARREKIFRDVIDPLYKELEPVAHDYINIFRATVKLIDEGEEINKIYSVLSGRREEMLTARIKLRSMAVALQGFCDNETVIEFGVAVNAFFYSTTSEVKMPLGAVSREEIINPWGRSSSGVLCDLLLSSLNPRPTNLPISYVEFFLMVDASSGLEEFVIWDGGYVRGEKAKVLVVIDGGIAGSAEVPRIFADAALLRFEKAWEKISELYAIIKLASC